MDTQMRKINISCAISIAVVCLRNGIFSISENVLDENNINSFILVCCSSVPHEKKSVQ